MLLTDIWQYGGLYHDTHLYCSNVATFLAGSGIQEPRFDKEQLERYLQHSVGYMHNA